MARPIAQLEDRAQKNHQIGSKAGGLNVLNVQLALFWIQHRDDVALHQLFRHSSKQAFLVGKLNGRSTGDARPAQHAQVLVLRNLWPRPYKAHLAADDVDQLGQLIELQTPQQGAKLCHYAVTVPRPRRPAVQRIATRFHRTKLEDDERLLVQSNSFLTE